MDQLKIGKFIAALRRQKGLTQEALGKKIGVTNKTVSRWENGNYMPDIEMLPLLANELDVSINELLAGEKLSDQEFRKKADENIIAVSKSSAFTLDEKKSYFKKKWLKEHIALIIMCSVVVISFCTYVYAEKHMILVALTPLIAGCTYAYLRNKMITYVEGKIYE